MGLLKEMTLHLRSEIGMEKHGMIPFKGIPTADKIIKTESEIEQERGRGVKRAEFLLETI